MGTARPHKGVRSKLGTSRPRLFMHTRWEEANLSELRLTPPAAPRNLFPSCRIFPGMKSATAP